jgi:hypothetical protein
MKYQAIQHLKTKSKLLKMCDTLQEAKQLIVGLGARYEGRSYVGGFPTFSLNNKRFSIQGAYMLSDGNHIVCSLPDKEAEEVEKA